MNKGLKDVDDLFNLKLIINLRRQVKGAEETATEQASMCATEINVVSAAVACTPDIRQLKSTFKALVYIKFGLNL